MSQTPAVHVVRRGDCIESIAAKNGCDFRALWDHPANRDLRELRASPNLLAPGDVVRIPASLRPEAQTIQAGGTHRFRARVPLTTVKLRLVHDEEAASGDTTEATTPPAPLANVPYRLSAGSLRLEGSTDSDGHIELEVPATLDLATLVIAPGGEDERWIELRIGHLDPIEGEGGIAQRLENLGHLSGLRTAEAIRRAVAAFQAEHGLEGDGELSAETSAKLREAHDG